MNMPSVLPDGIFMKGVYMTKIETHKLAAGVSIKQRRFKLIDVLPQLVQSFA